MPLGFIEVRNWLLALDMPFVEFTTQMEEVLDSTLTQEQTIAPPNLLNEAEVGNDLPQSNNPAPEPSPSPVVDDAMRAKFEAGPAYTAFLERLKAHRLHLGPTLEQMANHCNIDLNIAVGFEGGAFAVDFLIVRKWCQYSTPPAPPLTIFWPSITRRWSASKR